MFNLGYLPSGDHSISTRPETTIQALSKAMELLVTGGIITLSFITEEIPVLKKRKKSWNF